MKGVPMKIDCREIRDYNEIKGELADVLARLGNNLIGDTLLFI